MAKKRLPPWIKSNSLWSPEANELRSLLKGLSLHTVCQEARCPNMGECFSRGTATFLILGDTCTRNCRFCAVNHGSPLPPDPFEPQRVGQAVKKLGLKFAVITSVTRDDLTDGGAHHFAKTVLAIREANPVCLIEVLVPDFQGDAKAIGKVLESSPEVFGHNVETVPRLYPLVRPGADYQRSLSILKFAGNFSNSKTIVKSGFMVGLGETREEIRQLLEDLREAGCKAVTIGQYLRPRIDLLPVSRYYTPEEFQELKEEAYALGFFNVESGPLVRSSYHAERVFQK
ncbi:MAG: lipoyl synthase [Caldiserica bacterium]|jgi:lipoic acid synthetase|nr:lipoyl synthase [Caldisericota bacterium]MDH7563078.1 lipoyl synthase [Caldisericota bacterium]